MSNARAVVERDLIPLRVGVELEHKGRRGYALSIAAKRLLRASATVG